MKVLSRIWVPRWWPTQCCEWRCVRVLASSSRTRAGARLRFRCQPRRSGMASARETTLARASALGATGIVETAPSDLVQDAPDDGREFGIVVPTGWSPKGTEVKRVGEPPTSASISARTATTEAADNISSSETSCCYRLNPKIHSKVTYISYDRQADACPKRIRRSGAYAPAGTAPERRVEAMPGPASDRCSSRVATGRADPPRYRKWECVAVPTGPAF